MERARREAFGRANPRSINPLLVENMPSNVYEEEIDLSDLLPQQTRVEAAPLATQPSITLHENISRIVEAIEPPPLREVMLRIFTELARLLNYLELIEDGI